MSLTITTGIKVDYTANAYIDNAQEALVLLLEFLLVEDLHCEDALFGDFPDLISVLVWKYDRQQVHIHVKALIPVGIQSLLDDSGRARLLTTNGRDGEGVRESCNML